MKFINPKVEYWEQPKGKEGVWSQIARATRVCYQSTPRNNGETDEDFVNRVILTPSRKYQKPNTDGTHINDWTYDFERQHGAMLEHGTVYLMFTFIPSIPVDVYTQLAIQFYRSNKYSIIKQIDNTHLLVTTNMRVLLENDRFDDFSRFCEPSEHERRFTFSITTDIGVTREGNRHRVNSIAEESTRYNAYNKGKYGNEITYISPAWLPQTGCVHDLNDYASWNNLTDYAKDIVDGTYKTEWDELDYYIFGLESAEFAYMGLRQVGWTAEKARQVLNLNTKTQVVYTASESDWRHFIHLRANNVSGHVHPNMAVVGELLKKEIEKNQLFSL